MTKNLLRGFVIFSKAAVMVCCVIGVGWSIFIHSNSLTIVSLCGIGCVLLMDAMDDGYYDGFMWLVFVVVYVTLSFWLTFRWGIDVVCEGTSKNTNHERLAVLLLQEVYLPIFGEHIRGYRLSDGSPNKDELEVLCKDW